MNHSSRQARKSGKISQRALASRNVSARYCPLAISAGDAAASSFPRPAIDDLGRHAGDAVLLQRNPAGLRTNANTDPLARLPAFRDLIVGDRELLDLPLHIDAHSVRWA